MSEQIYKIEITTKHNKVGILRDAFFKEGITGMTIINVSGQGNQKGKVEIYRGSQITANLMPRIRVEIIAKAEDVERIKDIALKTLASGQVGDGKIVILPVADVIRIRTGQNGYEAI
ncbi:P-II family nitrogen regulator [Helicobacter sp. 13S00401-1]|uniref:P-II family nitrogen regulator n=1 Tax=Helicobacter sp. 13S00401-1 TaxID=1905758 RepID=UPI000BA697A6|nr:P-II family nitrogen regulator [Helicobacter sp. 13S00401-1]